MKDTILLPEYVKEALSCLTAKGFSAYVVGGCVRDSLLGHTPKDWDICTSALPTAVVACFPHNKVLFTGLAHGTVTVLHHAPLEITTLRTESAYSDHRHPDTIAFTTNLETDLRRRDFTINAMAYNEPEGLLDPLGGRTDLRQQRIRTVGDPIVRFQEDALRLLRAARFQAVLGFTIETATKTAMSLMCHTLRHTAIERQCAELCKLLCAPHAALAFAENQQLLKVILPELETVSLEPLIHTPALLHLRLTALFYHLHPNTAQAALQRLRLDQSTTQQVYTLLKQLKQPLPLTALAIKQLLQRTSLATVADYLSLLLAQEQCPKSVLATHKLFTEIIETGQCYNRHMLAINGKDLQQLGLPQGKKLGEILDALLDQVMTNILPNQRQPLLDAAKKHQNAAPPLITRSII